MADKISKMILPVKSGNVIAPKEFDVGGSDTNTFVGTTAEWEALTTEQQNAYDCRVLTDDDLDTKSVIDNLTSDSATDALSAKQGKVLAQLVAPVLSTLVAPTGGLAIGDQFVYNGLLYKATAAIAAGGAITINGNCELTDSVTEQINDIYNRVRSKIINSPSSTVHTLSIPLSTRHLICGLAVNANNSFSLIVGCTSLEKVTILELAKGPAVSITKNDNKIVVSMEESAGLIIYDFYSGTPITLL